MYTLKNCTSRDNQLVNQLSHARLQTVNYYSLYLYNNSFIKRLLYDRSISREALKSALARLILDRRFSLYSLELSSCPTKINRHLMVILILRRRAADGIATYRDIVIDAALIIKRHDTISISK